MKMLTSRALFLFSIGIAASIGRRLRRKYDQCVGYFWGCLAEKIHGRFVLNYLPIDDI